MRHERLARNMALKSTSKFRLGAVVIRKGRAIGAGYNKMQKTHPINKRFSNTDFDCGVHAEIDACIGLDADALNGSTVLVYRVLRNGDPALARPCSMCRKYLTQVGISKVIYTCADGYGELRL